MYKTWNMEYSHGAWVVDAAITAMVECVIASVYQLLNFSTLGKFFFHIFTRVGTLIMPTIYLQLIQNRYFFRSFTFLQCSHQHCVQPVASDVEVVGYL